MDWRPFRFLILAVLAVASPALATEGGTGHYLLGSRDALSGIAPPPGTYLSADTIYMDAAVDRLSIGGAVLANVSSQALITKLNFTHSFPDRLLGGRLMLTITQPVVTGKITFDGIVAGRDRRLSDTATGLGDTVVTPGLGWDRGASHFAVQTSLFLPLGLFQPTAIDIPNRDLTALSFSKNRYGFTPVFSFTHLPKSGFEVSASTGLSFSTRNQATDYQTAPEWHMEAAAVQHLQSGLALGMAGYAYAQLGEDNGRGADQLRAALDARSLKARVFGAGPLLTWSTKVGGTSLSLKAKYTHEFGARRRLEGDFFQLSLVAGF